MYKITSKEDVLDGIESNIEVTESHIRQLHLEFSTLGIIGQRMERRLILQQLTILEDNLELLKARRMFFLGPVH